MKFNKKTLFLVVGGLMMLIGFIQLKTPHYKSDEGGMLMLVLAGLVIALFGHPRGPIGILKDRFEGRGQPLPEQIRRVEFHGSTSVDRKDIIDAAMRTAARVSEVDSNIRVEDTRVDTMHLSIRGLFGLITQMSFTISWTMEDNGNLRVDIKVGQFLTTRPTIYWVIPIGRKRVVALPAMRRFRDGFVAELGASHSAPDSPTTAGLSQGPGLLPESVARVSSDSNGSVPPPPDHAPSGLQTSSEPSALFAESDSPESLLPADKTGSHLFSLTTETENGAILAVARQSYESGESALDSKKVDEYSDRAKGPRPALNPTPKPAFSFSTMSRKSIGIAAGGTALALVILGIFLGANSWRPSAKDSVQAAAPAPQPALAPVLPPSTPTQQATPSPTVKAAAPAAPSSAPTPTQAPAGPEPGDLGLTSPLRPFGCTDQFIVVYHSSTDPSVYAQDVQTNLASHPGSKYLLTLGSCSSLNRMSQAGTMIYTVYGGPYDTLAQACVAASRFPDQSYVKIMDAATAPDQALRSCQ